MGPEERTQAVPRMANPYQFGCSYPVVLIATVQLNLFGIEVGPPVAGDDSVVEIVDHLKKHQGEQVLISRFHCQVQGGYFEVGSHCV